MALEDIQREILSSAEKQAAQVIEAARLEASQILKKSEENSDQLQKQSLDQAHNLAEEMKEHQKLNSELEERKKMLALKQNLVEKIFQEALEKLKKLSDTDYGLLLENGLADLDGLQGILIPARGRETVTRHILGKTHLGHLKLAPESVEMAGGFLIKSRVFDLDFSFEAVLKNLKTSLEKEILTLLFKEAENEPEL